MQYDHIIIRILLWFVFRSMDGNRKNNKTKQILNVMPCVLARKRARSRAKNRKGGSSLIMFVNFKRSKGQSSRFNRGKKPVMKSIYSIYPSHNSIPIDFMDLWYTSLIVLRTYIHTVAHPKATIKFVSIILRSEFFFFVFNGHSEYYSTPFKCFTKLIKALCHRQCIPHIILNA